LVEVTFLDGSIETAEIIGTDPYSDMAVIKVEVPESMLYPVKMGVSSKMLVGEQVFALGNPFGLENTMTTGIISATGRRMDAPGGFTIVDVIQTDAAINPGNSGGPLLNLHGEVVGMNTAILSETRQFSGIGFAIPSDTITREVNSLIENGVYEHPWIGISGYEVTPAIAEAMNLNEETRGTLIATISEEGPAEDAGLRGSTKTETIGGVPFQIGGDIIIGADGVPMNTFYELIVYISREKRPGNTITFTIIRDGELLEQDLILGVRPTP
jgi:S1-C subfamily serine protease